jgi:phosphoserine aminotransferase
MRIHNFSAGPAILPKEVMQEASEAVISFGKSGLSILEMSHRGKEIIAVFDEAVSLVKELMELPDHYDILFVQGGASMQFSMVASNFLNTSAAYTNTGTWATKAIKEAQLYGNVQVLASSEESNFNYIPKDYQVPADVDYFHVTSNNTIYGTQLHSFPSCNVPLFCDMSSDIFSRKLDATQFGLIYAGVQKNMGPAGATMVIVDKHLYPRITRKMPSMFNYKIHAEAESMYNTPPVFAVYVSMLTLRWLKNSGGLSAMEVRNNEKAHVFYSELDRNQAFRGTVRLEDRSKMNANFVLTKPELEENFKTMLKDAGISGLNGHRSVGGFRASMYNALELESVKVLTEVMKSFEEKYN